MLPTIIMETEASHMLEAALEQMDDIIAGSKAAALELTNGVYDLSSAISSRPMQVIQLAVDLKLALELQENQEDKVRLREQLPTETAEVLKDWLQSGDVNLCPRANNESYQERLLRLEGDKESLVLQVSVLTDQVEAQGEKIRDLESSLKEHRQKLASTEEMLQQELVSRTSLETQKLDLMDEVSYLKLKLVSIEETRNTHLQDPMDTNQNKAECVVNLISELQEQMCRFQEEIGARIQEKRALEDCHAQHGESLADQAQGHSPVVRLSGTNLSLCDSGAWTHNGGLTANDLLQEVKQLKNKVDDLESEKGEYERQLRVTKSLMTQLSSLKLTVGHTQQEKQQCEERWRSAQAEISDLQQLLASKDAEFECLQTQLLARGSAANHNAEREEVYIKQLINKYHEYQRLKAGMESLLASNDEKTRRIEELTNLLGQYRKIKEFMALTHGSSEEELSGSLTVRAITHKAYCDIYRSEMSSRGSSPLMLSSSPYQRELDSCFHNSMDVSRSTGDTSFLNGLWHQRRLQSSSLEELQSRSLQKPVEILPDESESDIGRENPHMELNKYQTLPGKLNRKGELRTKKNGDSEREDEYLSPVRLSLVSSHDQDYSLKCSEQLEESILSNQSPLSSGMDSGQHSPMSPENRKSQRGIKKLWGLIRRSQSGSPIQIHDPELGDFKRGTTRATAGPRLARSGNIRDLKMPFSKWSTEQVCEWLEDIGLGQYAILAQQWVTSGQSLMSANAQDLEKEMVMKNPLHRKKLHLSMKTLTSKQHEKSAELDYLWVTRWLDDIGLPQYKDQFNEGRVDGQMLQYLTVNDLLVLKVTSQLHHLSIKCAIHVLHVNKFNPYCLKRRPGTENKFIPSEVVQWSNHRVMEWLRSVDLAEYAPNLRGSGVHGGLIMLEPRFNSDSLAMLLNIPPQKTLLRRHLTTNFSKLVGAQAQQEKREYTEAVNYTPLSITAKVKPKKLGFSNLRRRRSDESTDYVCPVESARPLEGHSTVNGTQMHHFNNTFRGLSPILDTQPDHTRHQPSIAQPASHPNPVLLNPAHQCDPVP
ncbi:liprin-beta-2b isoform X4 [Phyllopteryx taeniolatus]|uniref:liprin-beta-2b isoform X4 n=1 Tax=Phyllopteryx taeniolatus TaxID=161469 RepID=UPI002AD4B915|nr:liprin-beta-2b isoform X4 [Phyllopteryx taeniolatus]